MARFRHNGYTYVVAGELVGCKFLLEPDGVLLTISIWGMSDPPSTIPMYTTVEKVDETELEKLRHTHDVQVATRE